MAADQLSLYNGALRLLGQRKLASLSEEREPRYLLDDVWDDGAIKHCLEQGQWSFAIRAQAVTYNPSIEPPFGYRYAFDQPDDLVTTTAVCDDELYRSPLLEYVTENNYWYSNLQVMYVKYVSSDSAYGNDLSLWPESFKRYVEGYLAEKIALVLCQLSDNKMAMLERRVKKLMKDARSKDAQEGPTKMLPAGSWRLARSGRRGNSSYRGETY